MEPTYTVTVTFTVHEHSDPYLQSVPAIEEEFEHWLENRKVTVHMVTVKPVASEGSSR